MKELSKSDLMYALEQDIKMALYTLDRYNVDANLALVACDDHNVDKAHLIENVRQSDVAKKINDHYVAILFTFVDHVGARCALEKVMNRYPQYDLKGSLIVLKKGETVTTVCERILEANHAIHFDTEKKLFDETEYAIVE